MIQISQLKLKIPHSEEDLRKKTGKILRIQETEILSFRILKRSLDARRKPELFYVYTVEVELEVKQEQNLIKRNRDKNVVLKKKKLHYRYITDGTKPLSYRPVVVGSGPAGLFCAYSLALRGYRPILLERGEAVEDRMKDVESFWENGRLNLRSNVQFGEGGAGTFSDGKLNTLVHDTFGRGREVLQTFVKFGAPEQILYDNKPHIGTDILVNVVRNMRTALIHMGAEVRFHTQVTDIEYETSGSSKRLCSLELLDTHSGEKYVLDTELAVFAIGHSARDTFVMLKEQNIPMEAKAFAVGVRVEHPQSMINESQYGYHAPKYLPAAAYKLTANLENGRGVYTFCMCPGGYVVNASSEDGCLAVNGMSYSGRGGKNANSAVIVTVTPEDYGTEDVLAGVEFQRTLEKAAYRIGNGKIPVQLFKDFCADVPSQEAKGVLPQMKGAYTFANVRAIFPAEIAASIEEGIYAFDRKIKGYAQEDIVLSGVESRTSSPVRILRNETMQSEVEGFYPCGEGAGYAGGITSAAMDGLKVAEAISHIYRPFDKERLC